MAFIAIMLGVTADAGQHETLESLQKRAMRIIINHDDYTILLIIAGIDNLQTRCEHLTEQFSCATF